MGPLVRIIARVGAGVMIGHGWVSLDQVDQVFSDPASDAAFDIIAGGAVWAGTEFYYAAAKWFGWRT